MMFIEISFKHKHILFFMQIPIHLEIMNKSLFLIN